MAKVTVTLEVEESVVAGLDAAVKRDEFATTAIENGQPVRKQLYASGRDFLARRIVRDGLMNVGHMIPAVAELRQAISDQQAAIDSLLTPSVVEGGAAGL